MLGLGLAGTAACLLTASAAAVLPEAVTLPLMAVSTLGASVYPLGLTIISDAVRPSQRVGASATALLLAAVGAIAGPLVAARFMALLGPAGLFVGGAVAFATLALGAAWRQRGPEPDHVVDFVPLPRTTSVVRELDPEESQVG